MMLIPVRTRVLVPPQDDLFPILDSLPRLTEGDVVLIASKIVSIYQGRCVRVTATAKVKQSFTVVNHCLKQRLVTHEADAWVSAERGGVPILTIKNHTIIPFAGVDESNGKGYFVLWPKNPSKAARLVCQYLKKTQHVSRLGVIITDSVPLPLRRGVVGISIGSYGIEPLRDYRGARDIFGRKLKITQTNVVDGLASAAVLLMGEGREQTPIVIARGAPVRFTSKRAHGRIAMPRSKDMYAPLLSVMLRKEDL